MTQPNKKNESQQPDLVGFLLGALEPSEHAQVEQAIDQSHELGLKTGLLRRSLKRIALNCRPDHEEPPPRLAERTCRWIWDQVQQPLTLSEALPVELACPPRSSAADIVVAAGVLFVALAIFLPALQVSRFHSGILACQQKLQEVGTALHTYSELQPDHSFPRVETTGNRAAAGIYAPVLVSHELINNRSSFFCPQSSRRATTNVSFVPTLEEVDQATGEPLAQIQSTMGGSFAYSLGHMDGDRYVAPVNRHRENFALLGDAPPVPPLRSLQENSVGGSEAGMGHAGRGQNIFYEDGHVKYIVHLPLEGPIDNPFVNRQRIVAAGMDPNDAVLGSSAAAPFTADFNPTLLRVSAPQR